MKLGDLETGEFLVELKGTDRIKVIRENTKKYLNEKVKPLIKHYTKINTDEFMLLNNELSNTEKIFLFSIIPYIDYETCQIKFNNQYDIKLNNLITITNISEKTIRIIINSLINKMIIYKDKKIYYVNPWLMSKGEKINKSLFFLFSDYKIRSKNNIEWKCLK